MSTEEVVRERKSSLWKREINDWYQEPAWTSKRLFDVEPFQGEIFDPAAGAGTIVKSAIAAGYAASGSDLIIRSKTLVEQEPRDWLAPSNRSWDNIVSNPPFKLCDDKRTGTFPFVERCLERARRKVALLLPSKWIQGDKRSRWLAMSPLRAVYYLTPRPSMPPGHVIAAGMKPGNGTTDFAWYVWLHGYDGEADTRWIRRDP